MTNLDIRQELCDATYAKSPHIYVSDYTGKVHITFRYPNPYSRTGYLYSQSKDRVLHSRPLR